MTKRRGNNEGSIYQRSDGRWCATVTTGRDASTGQLKRKSFYGKNRQEVVEKLNKCLNSIFWGTYVEPSKITINEWIDFWLEEYKKPNVRPKTFTSYEYLVRVHIKPSIGYILLKDLRPEQLQKLYNEKLKHGNVKNSKGLSSRTIKYIHTIIHESFEQAVKNGMITRNVSKLTNLPRKNKKEIRILTVEEQNQLLNVLSDNKYHIAIKLALFTGLRIGEICALSWSDVNLNEGVIRVKRTLSQVKNLDDDRKTNYKFIFQEPKTKSSKRSIPLSDSIVSMLNKHRLRQAEHKLQASDDYKDNDLVFCTENGDNFTPTRLTRKFYTAVKKAGIDKINFHALRHTFATRMLELNIHPKVVQEMLGHSSITMTLDTYSHVLPERKQEAAQKLDAFFERKNSSASEGI